MAPVEAPRSAPGLEVCGGEDKSARRERVAASADGPSDAGAASLLGVFKKSQRNLHSNLARSFHGGSPDDRDSRPAWNRVSDPGVVPYGTGERTGGGVSSGNEARTACYVLYCVWRRWLQHKGRKRPLLQNQRQATLQWD